MSESLQLTVTIADDGTESSVIAAKGFARGGFACPAGFVGTAMTFQVSTDNSTFYAHEAAGGSATSVTVEASKAYAIPSEVMAWPFIKLVSGSSETGGPLTIPVTLVTP